MPTLKAESLNMEMQVSSTSATIIAKLLLRVHFSIYALPHSLGGPLVISTNGTNVTQVGIASFDFFNSSDYYDPDVYTRVSAVADWIKSTVCNRTGELCVCSHLSSDELFVFRQLIIHPFSIRILG